jgi:hypothetical protein
MMCSVLGVLEDAFAGLDVQLLAVSDEQLPKDCSDRMCVCVHMCVCVRERECVIA